MPTLSWLTREDDLRRATATPYRLLEEVPEHGYGNNDTKNMLIQGDNLEALKALLPYFAGRVRCIYIDPPYNTRSAFEQYDDNLEHSQWLAMIWPRLELLREFLSNDGSIWISIDDNEAHYLKVALDEIFGRKKFVANLTWQKRYSRDNNAAIGDVHEHILIYATDPEVFKKHRNRVEPDEKTKRAYSNPNDDPKGPWQSISFTGAEYRANMMYPIEGPDGRIHHPPEGRHWAALEPEYRRLEAEGRIWFGKDGKGVPRVIRYLSEVEGLVPWSWLPHEEVGHTGEAKQEVNAIFGAGMSFDTPKPERLLRRIIHIATNPGDIVLDSFLGSGTTAAVAHKMDRCYIGIEMGEHAVTHCTPRLKQVVDGEQGGISEGVGWNGGGGFRFYRLGHPVFDEQGQVVSDISFSVLAAHVWFCETSRPWISPVAGPFLGVWMGRAYALLYNGVLGDKKIDGGNVLTRKTLEVIRQSIGQTDKDFDGPLTVYGEQSRLGPGALERERITFKQTPYDIKARA